MKSSIHRISFYTAIGLLVMMGMAYNAGVLFGQEESGSETGGYEYPPYESFAVIFQSNIFDPNRRPARREEQPEIPPRRDPDEAILTGTMITEDDAFAFFNGSRSDFRAVVSTGNTYAGFTIAAIEKTKVILTKENAAMTLPVGMALIKEEDGEWEISTPSKSNRSLAYEREDRDNHGGAQEKSTESGDVQNDVLKRLMEQRKQEVGQ